MIGIVPFREEHFTEAARIAFAHWGKEHRSADEATRHLIYEYLVRYYFHPESPYSFAAVEADRVYGLLLAHPPGTPPYPADEWLASRLDPGNRGIFREYVAYLDGNRHQEERHCRKDEVILALFASCRPGCGRLLMQTFAARCRQDGWNSMLLWTDDTCDVAYYPHNGFTETARFATDPTFDGRTLTTYLFRKTFGSMPDVQTDSR